jgi:flagellar protein FlgJ
MAVRLDPNVSVTPAREQSAAPVNAHDFKQFAALRRGAQTDDPAVLREAARQFESLFTKMMLEGMRSASFGDPMFGSDQADMYQDMMDDQMAVQLSAGRGIGLADMLIRQLSQGGPGAHLGAHGMTSGAQWGGPVMTSGAQAALGPDSQERVSDQQRQQFVEQMRPHAEAAARELGVDPRSVIAQAALETGWGRSQPGHGPDEAGGASNNYFGIKAGASWRGDRVAADTTEFTGGVAGTERAQFRAYGSVAENMSDYVRVLRDPRYTSALNTGADVQAFARGLQRGGYATDPQYADKLVAVAAQIDRLDVKSFKSAPEAPISTQDSSSPPSRTRNNG